MAQVNGLLDWIQTPAGIGLLSAVAGGMAGARRGTPWNNVGRGLITGVAGYQGAQDQLRQQDENALTKQLRQMQMQELESKLANQKRMRESLQSLYKPAGTTPFQADNPFDEDLGNLQTETQATFGGKPVDPVMAAVLPYAQPDDILKLMEKRNNPAEQFGKIMPHSYTPESLSAYQQSGNYSDLKPIGNGAEFGKVNPGQFTPESLARYAETGHYGDLVQFRSPTQIDRGNEKVLYDPGTRQTQTFSVAPSPDQMPAFKAAQTAATETAKATVEREVGRPKAESKLAAETDKSARLTSAITKAKEQVGALSAGPVGQATSWIGGSPAKNLEASLATVKANLGFDELQQMRDNSPTGGALGQVAVQEIGYLQSVVASLDQSQSPEQLRQNLDIILKAKQESDKRIKAAYEKTYPTSNNSARRGGTLSQGEILNVELEDAIARGDNQNANLIRQEMSRMGMKAPGATKPAVNQSAGTFKDPIRVTNDADYNSVPKGKYYQAPDGSIRIRK